MRILHITSTPIFYPGGMEKVIWEISKRLAKNHDVTVLQTDLYSEKDFHEREGWSVILSTYVMFILVQFLNIAASFKLISKIYPSENLARKIIKTLKLVKWIIRDFEGYQATRKILKANMKKFSMPEIYNLMAR